MEIKKLTHYNRLRGGTTSPASFHGKRAWKYNYHKVKVLKVPEDKIHAVLTDERLKKELLEKYGYGKYDLRAAFGGFGTCPHPKNILKKAQGFKEGRRGLQRLGYIDI